MNAYYTFTICSHVSWFHEEIPYFLLFSTLFIKEFGGNEVFWGRWMRTTCLYIDMFLVPWRSSWFCFFVSKNYLEHHVFYTCLTYKRSDNRLFWGRWMRIFTYYGYVSWSHEDVPNFLSFFHNVHQKAAWKITLSTRVRQMNTY